eukprot:CAMPEP_0178448602 /NCGR_PEP_ID=MMETSP0689_2-20121128/42079_1 /TAXON_ID=160604 /ORGANISM="Amphidinium massartii, Strain CS-259" /LENGTH=134 /DNA_ID=CAMNT_0020073813 /DNA_START=1 /DNA_END=402 /DNA_ORIENTATION=+
MEAACSAASTTEDVDVVLQLASKELLRDGSFVLEVLERTQAWWHLRSAALQLCPTETLQAVAARVVPRLLLRITTLSGRSCVLVANGAKETPIIRILCGGFLRLSKEVIEKTRLVLGTEVMPEDVPLSGWPCIE